jgi:sulfur-oxidizing protein SoxZ
MAKIKPRVKVPRSAAPGEAVTVKTLISHPMESGQRKDSEGNPIPRQIIHTFKASFDGQEILTATFEPAVSSNPYVEFEATVPAAGTFRFEWHDDDGSVYELEEAIEVG